MRCRVDEGWTRLPIEFVCSIHSRPKCQSFLRSRRDMGTLYTHRKGTWSSSDIATADWSSWEGIHTGLQVYKSLWKKKIDSNEYPFNFFRKRRWSDTWYITVVPADPCPEYGNDESITPNGKTVWVPGGSVVLCFRCIPLWVNGNEPNNNSPIEKAFDNDRERYDAGLEVRVFVLVKLWGKIKRIGGRRVFWIGMIVSKEPNKRLQYTVLHLI